MWLDGTLPLSMIEAWEKALLCASLIILTNS